MPFSCSLRVVRWITWAMVAGTACDGPTAPEADGKIDGPVVALMESTADPIPVIVLGSHQVLDPPTGFAEFTATSSARDRRELRTEMIDLLKATADAEQELILAGLGHPDGARRFWLVNAIAVPLTPADIRRAAALDEVRFIYPAGEVAPAIAATGGVREAVTPAPSPFSPEGKTIPWNVERIGAARVWTELGVTGEGATVALLDAGVDYTHASLRNNMWVNEGEVPNDGVDNDGNGYPDDYYGFDFATMRPEVGDFTPSRQHGTWVAGIVAGDGSEGIVTGVAPRASIMALRWGTLDGVISAHQYALEMGADVMNMSFSIPDLDNVRGLWRIMSDHAVAAGLVLVSGAGNFRQSAPIPEQLRVPEGIPSVIGVGGVDENLGLVVFSSTGPVEWASVALYGDHPSLLKPDVVAFPGAGYPILATGGSGYIDPNTRIRGNSFSGPHAAGAAALILSANPALPAWRVREILEATAVDLGEPGKDNLTGAGLIDAFAAVQSSR